jgi:hypothetical protein
MSNRKFKLARANKRALNMKEEPTRGRWRRLLTLLGGAVFLLLLVIITLWIRLQRSIDFAPGFQSKDMAAAQYATRDVTGNLGGMPVTMPRHFAQYVEYDDDDPAWGEKRRTPRPARTQQSRLRSFDFPVRHPDMAGESSPELIANKKSHTIFNTPWIRVGISTGADYPGHGFLDRRTHAEVEVPQLVLKYANYEKLPKEQYGLTVYAASGFDPANNKPYREHPDADDIFINRNQAGQVTTHIRCSNRKTLSAPCAHSFSLEPDIKAKVNVSYRRGLLPEWRSIQDKVSSLIRSFRSFPVEPKTISGN